MRLLIWLCMLVVLPAARADDGLWKLVWEDDFERAELGDGWFLRRGKAKIVDGRLFLPEGAPIILVNRGFAPDVKVEFVAEANPDTPPCDLSVAMAGSELGGYGHLLAFGGRNNQINQIVGSGAHARDENPPLLIEHGKKYKLVAVKEGSRLAYFVDGVKIVETEVAEPLGGPGFDRVGLVTWNGMYVDSFKVYERTTPAPGGPVVLKAMPATAYVWKDRMLTYLGGDGLSLDVAKGVELYNQRKYREAFEALAKVSPSSWQSVVALAYVLGDLAYEMRPGDQQKLVELAAGVARRSPNARGRQDFALAAQWFSRITITSRDRIACTRLTVPGPQNNPFYYKAKLFTARFHYASACEGGDAVRKKEALDMFAELKDLWPEHQALREFSGERVPWGEELIHDESDGPAWARYLQEAFARQQAVLNWWATVRQAPDGQLGGGWGDDVEILRSWVPAACVSTACETSVAGIERLAQGVWRSVLQDGYDRGIGDVEHSSEPSADALPTMILLRYGDPQWVEYNLRSAKTIRERFMGINDRGFLHFKSTEFGAGGVNTNPRAGGDTGYHARAMKHFIWLAWYGIGQARDVFCQWCDGWRDVTMRKIGNKPPGFAPASVWYPGGSISPPNGRGWYDGMSNYYGFPGLPGMVHDGFLTAHLLSGDRKFLDPVQTMMDLATTGPLHKYDKSLPPDDMNNLLAAVAHQAGPDVTSVYRWLTGERVYDEYTLRHCTPTQRYMIDCDLETYGKSFERLAGGMRHNWALRTSEVLQTDRAGLGGATEVCGAYTGAVCSFRDSRAPTLSVTYDTPDLNFAAVVTEATPERLRVCLYNFNQTITRMGLRPWRLMPGVYVLNTGEPVPGERPSQKRCTWSPPVEVEHRHRGTPIRVYVPPKKVWVVDLRLRKRIERPALLPDLAIAPRDIHRQGGRLTVTVHNIGGAEAGPFLLVLEARAQNGWLRIADKRVDGLPAIENFEPVRRDVELQAASEEPLAGEYRVLIDPDDEVDELYELNNAVRINDE